MLTINREDGYELCTDPGRLDVDLVHGWLSTDAYWALGRPRDVFDRTERGRGLGSWLVGQVRDDLTRQGVRRILLATNDAHGVYARLGFQPLDQPDRWLVRERTDSGAPPHGGTGPTAPGAAR